MRSIVMGILVVIVTILGFISFGLLSLETYKFFAPKWENARREVYENTYSYQQGKMQEERKIQREASRNPENADVLDNIYDHIKR